MPPPAMPPLDTITTVAAMWLVAVAIPGPNFFVVARMAAGRSRREALATVAAIGIGSLCWGLAGLFGMHALFALAPWLYGGLKLLGAVYLTCIGGRIIAGSFRPEPATPAAASGAAFRLGLMTSLSNPKSALLVASLFTAALPPGAPLSVGLWTVAEMVVISLAWSATLACVISTHTVATLFRRFRTWIDRCAGAIFIAFGARLAINTALGRP